MNSAHDLGGMHGFGPIDRSQIENFVSEWEEKVFALTLACGMLGQWNLDQSRFAREKMDPGHYLCSSYYEHWLSGLELLLKERDMISQQEIDAGVASNHTELTAVLPEQVQTILDRGGATELPCQSAAQYAVGDVIRVRNFNPKSHTRAPRYIRGQIGSIVMYHGCHIFPDVHAALGKKQPAHLYNVRFEAETLWGKEDAERQSAVYVDIFEPYMESVDGV